VPTLKRDPEAAQRVNVWKNVEARDESEYVRLRSRSPGATLCYVIITGADLTNEIINRR